MKLINLLPKARQQELHFEALFRSLGLVVAVSLAGFVAVFLVQVASKIYLQAKASAITAEIAQLKSQVDKKENADLKKQIQSINGLIADYNTLSDTAPKWSRVLEAFAPLPPLGVKINSFSVDAGKKSIYITGFSPTREQVIRLYNNIKSDSKNFKDIDYPLENVVKATDVNFHFMFYMTDELLK